MNENLGNIVIDNTTINLDICPIEMIKTEIQKIDEKEKNLKQELDNILSNLY